MTRLSQSAARTRPANWDTPTFSDGLGDRLVTFDSTTGSSLELLRFKPEFCKIPQFEEALRQRVEALASFTHPSIAGVRSVEWLGDDGLALVSNHVTRIRLSKVQSAAHGPEFATEIVAQLTPVLAAVQKQGEGFAHGLLTAERILVAPEGVLVLTEHVIGSAIDALHLPPDRLREEFGLFMRPGSVRVDDPQADVIQLGCLAVTLLVGQHIRSLDAARDIVGQLNSRTVDGGREIPPHLIQWLQRALDVDGTPFVSASDAEQGLIGWPGLEHPVDPSLPSRQPTPVQVVDEPVQPEAERQSTVHRATAAVATMLSRAPARNHVLIAALSVACVVLALIAANLFTNLREAESAVSTASSAREATAPTVPVPAVPPGGTAASASPETLEPPAPAPKPTAAAPSRPTPPVAPSGWLTIQSPLTLQLYRGQDLIGTSNERVDLPPGRHTLRLVNTSLEFATSINVEIGAGRGQSMRIPAPTVSLSLNALPWADVSLDGQALGSTPVANLSVPIGTHELIWRHPQLGERRETVVLTVKTPVRLVADLRR
jgi:hypothetical protein